MKVSPKVILKRIPRIDPQYCKKEKQNETTKKQVKEFKKERKTEIERKRERERKEGRKNHKMFY